MKKRDRIAGKILCCGENCLVCLMLTIFLLTGNYLQGQTQYFTGYSDSSDNASYSLTGNAGDIRSAVLGPVNFAITSATITNATCASFANGSILITIAGGVLPIPCSGTRETIPRSSICFRQANIPLR